MSIEKETVADKLVNLGTISKVDCTWWDLVSLFFKEEFVCKMNTLPI